MAKSRSSFLNSAEGLLGNKEEKVKVKVRDAHEVQEVHDVHEVHHVQEREYGTTQGKKGQHAKRINMAFSDANHEYITKESRRQGMSATAFVNMIIDEYKTRV